MVLDDDELVAVARRDRDRGEAQEAAGGVVARDGRRGSGESSRQPEDATADEEALWRGHDGRGHLRGREGSALGRSRDLGGGRLAEVDRRLDVADHGREADALAL